MTCEANTLHQTCAFEIPPPSSCVWNRAPGVCLRTSPSRNDSLLLFHSVVNVQDPTCP